MQHATTRPTLGPLVMPDSEEQCKLMYGPDELISLGDFGRSAGYGVPVLMTAEAGRHIIGPNDAASPQELAERLAESLERVHAASSTRLAIDAFTIETDGEEAVTLLVRQHLVASKPYTLITLWSEAA